MATKQDLYKPFEKGYRYMVTIHKYIFIYLCTYILYKPLIKVYMYGYNK